MNARIISAGVLALALAIAATATTSYAAPLQRKTLSGSARIVTPIHPARGTTDLTKPTVQPKVQNVRIPQINKTVKPKVAKPVVKKKIRSATKTTTR